MNIENFERQANLADLAYLLHPDSLWTALFWRSFYLLFVLLFSIGSSFFNDIIPKERKNAVRPHLSHNRLHSMNNRRMVAPYRLLTYSFSFDYLFIGWNDHTINKFFTFMVKLLPKHAKNDRLFYEGGRNREESVCRCHYILLWERF